MERVEKIEIIMVAVALVMLYLLWAYPFVANFIMLLNLFIFGGFSTYLKEERFRLIALALLIGLSLANVMLNGIKWGIDFKGGTRIPLTLEKPVDTQTMQEIVQKIKTRASALGMEQVVVKAVGDDLIYVEVPSDNEEILKKIEDIITKQGVFVALVDNQIALKGDDILPGTISPVPPQYLHGADWGVAFSITPEAAERFAKIAKGKTGYPVYMFLDKPDNAVILLDKNELQKIIANYSIDYVDFITTLREVLDNPAGHIELAFELKDLDKNKTYIVLNGSKEEELLRDKGYRVLSYNKEDLYPKIVVGGNNIIVNEWRAIGLISAPTLSKEVTQGRVLLGYTITGHAKGYGQERILNAKEEQKTMISLLKGGAFPVKIEAGSRTTVPPTLGEKFLNYSIIAMAVALFAVALFVSLRYKKVRIIIPMLLVTLFEVIILLSLVGSFTIDLAAMAGIIASVGVSIDAQIVITDELLKAKDHKEALKRAFEIINNNAIVAILALSPLFFIKVVEVVGFAISTVFAYVLGVLISRPAYAAMVERWLK